VSCSCVECLNDSATETVFVDDVELLPESSRAVRLRHQSILEVGGLLFELSLPQALSAQAGE
jgi:predicted component of type VI protein secretion system